jgi:hypothetical protein
MEFISYREALATMEFPFLLVGAFSGFESFSLELVRILLGDWV